MPARGREGAKLPCAHSLAMMFRGVSKNMLLWGDIVLLVMIIIIIITIVGSDHIYTTITTRYVLFLFWAEPSRPVRTDLARFAGLT